MIPGALYTPTIRKTRGVFYTHQIDQSIRFDGSATMTRQWVSDGNRRTFTISTWIKPRGNGTCGIASGDGDWGQLHIDSSGNLLFYDYGTDASNTGNNWYLKTQRLFRDPAAWYHIVAICDTTQAISSNRIRLYVNGIREIDLTNSPSPLYPALNFQCNCWGRTRGRATPAPFYIGGYGPSGNGYFAEIYYLDGVVAEPSEFGELKEGIWIPKEYTGSVGTEGHYITGANSADLGADYSDNGNDFTSTGLASTDQMSDSPTFGSTSEGNHCTWNPLNVDASVTFSDGNLTVSTSGADPRTAGTLGGRIDDADGYYFETVIDADASDACTVGIITDERANKLEDEQIHSRSGSFMWRSYSSGQFFNETTTETSQGTFNPGDVLGWFVKGSTLYVRKNNSNVVGDVVAGTGGMSISSGTYFFPAFTSSVGGSGTSTVTLKSAENLWSYTPPSGFKPLNTKNLSDPVAAIDPNKGANPTNYFDVITYEGNGGGQKVGQFVPLTELYTVPNSVIFNDNDSAYLTKTFASDGNRRTWTFSTWVKFANIKSDNVLFSSWISSGATAYQLIYIDSAYKLRLEDQSGNRLITNQVFRDSSAWNHIVARVDTTDATSADRFQLYVNGVRVTSFSTETQPSLNFEGNINKGSQPHYLGRNGYSLAMIYSDLYQAETHFIDGTALDASSFGQLDASTNKWIPKQYTGSYGTNGFYLDMETAPGTGSGAGTDSSGNGNNFTESGLAAADQVDDSPTKNFVTFDPLLTSSYATTSNGNLDVFGNTATNNGGSKTTLTLPNSGKYYIETTFTTGSSYPRIGASVNTKPVVNGGNGPGDGVNGWGFSFDQDGQARVNGTNTASWGSAVTNGQIVQLFFDMDNGAAYIGINNTLQNSGNPSSGSSKTGAIATWQQGQYNLVIEANVYNTSSGVSINAGQRSFSYTPPTGYVSINNDNLPLTDAGLSAFVWIKNRDAADNHMLFDAVRGVTKDLHSNNYDAEVTNVNTLQRFLKNGFQIGNDVEVNTLNESYVAWQWMADSLSTSSNTDGSITSTVLANQDAGFSIITYTGTGSAGDSVGHGLGVTPAFVLTKNLAGAGQGIVYNKDLGATKYLILNSAGAVGTSSGAWNNTEPTSSIVTLGGGGFGTNNVGNGLVMYAFAEVEGFSKIGSYQGNGSSDGPFVYCGFRPAFIIGKNSGSGTDNWWMWDTARNTYNVVNSYLSPTTSTAQATAAWLDITSNGFKLRDNGNGMNTNAGTIIFMAFADQPLKYANAR